MVYDHEVDMLYMEWLVYPLWAVCPPMHGDFPFASFVLASVIVQWLVTFVYLVIYYLISLLIVLFLLYLKYFLLYFTYLHQPPITFFFSIYYSCSFSNLFSSFPMHVPRGMGTLFTH